LREAENRPIYIDTFPAAWDGIFHAVPVGGVYRLEPVLTWRVEGYLSDAR
jgi:hypothetical protein